MPIKKLLRALRGDKKAEAPSSQAARQPTAPRATTPAPTEPLWISMEELPGAWSERDSRLTLRTDAPIRQAQPVRVRITSRSTELDVQLEGTAATAARDAKGTVVSVVLDRDGVAMVERLLKVLRGEADPIAHRKPRYRISLPAVVTSASGKTFMNTVSVSLDGCGLAWSGPVPRTGSGLFVQLGSGSRAVSFRAMTCWARETPRGARVGVRFVGGDRTAWTELLAQISRGAERS